MARILFLENREKTYFWAAVARLLEKDGHDLAWIVQNPVFGNALPGRTHVIPFPSRRALSGATDLSEFPALVTDRGREYFGAGSAHYRYYAERVEAILSAEKPDLVVGEPTLFHELLAVDLCAREGILFAHPVGERYPPDRFTIFGGATQLPLLQSGDTLASDAALDLATRIRDGEALPKYMMSGGRADRYRLRLLWAATRTRVLLGRWRGERYNTPSPVRKMSLNRGLRRNIARWISVEQVPTRAEQTILYPLQMQPENTIDVWGRPDWDQVDVLRRLLIATPPDVTVAVKANPKPYYEMSNRLLDFAADQPRVALLPLTMKMAEAVRHTTGAVTVTGTVGYEAVCGRGRCLSVAHPVLTDHFPAFAAGSVEEAALRLLTDPSAGCGSPAIGARLMQQLTARSFAGSISDPVSDPASMAACNIAAIAVGVARLLDRLPFSPVS